MISVGKTKLIAIFATTLALGTGTAGSAGAGAKVVPKQASGAASVEQRNLALVLQFSEAAFNRHDVDSAAPMLTDDYIQHNPRIPNGRAAFIQFIKASAAARPNARSTILRSAASGDLVWTHVKVSDGSGKGDIVLVNIFRVADGKIAEHWDVIQPVPDATANTNTMF